MKISKILLLAFATAMAFTAAASAAEPKASTGAGTVVIRGKIENTESDYLTVSLIKNGTDTENPTDGAIGYLEQYKLSDSGEYDIKFDFADFTYDENGNVNNYSLYMHTAGVSVMPSVALAERTGLSLAAQVYVSQGATKASVIAEIENMKDTPTIYSMIMACYDNTNKLLGIVREEKISSALSEEKQYLNTALPDGTVRVKAFVWDSISGMLPLYSGETTEPLFGVYDFEADTADEDWFWVGKGSNTVTEEKVYSGQKSGKLFVASNGTYFDSKQILSELYHLGNGEYKATAYIMPESNNAKVRAALQYKDVAGNYILSSASETTELTAGEWNKIEQTINVNLSGLESEARLQLAITEGSGQNFYFDDISFVPTGELTPVTKHEDAKVFLIGDSLCDKYGANENDQQGWSYYLRPEFADTAVFNCATGGWSTKSFIYGHTADWGQFGERWNTYLDIMNEGDYVLVSLGTNDYKTTVDNSESYRKNITKMYNDVTAKGATMVFITPCPLAGDDYWTDEGTMRTDDGHTALISIMNEIEGAAVLGMNAEMKEYLNGIGKESTLNDIFVSDKVHVTSAGAKKISDIIVELIKAEPSLSGLAELLK